VQTRIHTQNSYQPENTPFGDNIEYKDDITCFLFHNINGVKDEANWAQITSTMHELQVTGFGFTKANTTYRGWYHKKWHSITRKIFKTSRTITSESDIIYNQPYKPGGTLTTVVGNGNQEYPNVAQITLA
jgi:hypothetical protein